MCCNYYRANYKNKLCSSHAFNYEKLEENILDIIKNNFKKIDIKLIKDNTNISDDTLKKIINLEINTKELISKLIERIEISKEKKVIIFFNFKILQNK